MSAIFYHEAFQAPDGKEPLDGLGVKYFTNWEKLAGAHWIASARNNGATPCMPTGLCNSIILAHRDLLQIRNLPKQTLR